MKAVSVLAAAAIATTLILAVTGVAARAYRDADFVQYYAGARLVAQEASPYDIDAWQTVYDEVGSAGMRQAPHTGIREQEWTTPYPLWLFVLLAPLGSLPFAWVAAIWLVLEVVAVAVAWAMLSGALYRVAPRRDAVLLGGLMLAFQPLWTIVAGGNVTGFLLLALIVALDALTRGRPARSGLSAVPLALKAHLFGPVGIALLVVAAGQRVRFVVAGTLGLVGVVAVALAVDPSWIAKWLRNAFLLQASVGSNATGWTADRILGGLPIGPLVVAIALFATAAWWWAARPAPFVLVASAVPVSLFAAPHGWSYDYVLLLLPLAVAIALVQDAPALERGIVIASLAVVFGVAPWALRYLAYVRGGEEWNVLLLLLAMAFVPVLERRRRARAALWRMR